MTDPRPGPARLERADPGLVFGWLFGSHAAVLRHYLVRSAGVAVKMGDKPAK
ncbi:hypothetical protein [Kibdelosporangium persicum]|uniref:hypothetical protein n=1 Tax=Kibdelosporangium persicum TaxID=2698649 RepID=UPI0015632D15|nr:hypothetical protein [Kibdelosporangium persicum]